MITVPTLDLYFFCAAGGTCKGICLKQFTEALHMQGQIQIAFFKSAFIKDTLITAGEYENGQYTGEY